MFKNIVYMKYGYHAKEHEQDIVKRKKLEFQKSGKMFWGYGGVVCHPIKQVQPFAKKFNDVFLAMSLTSSKPTMEGYLAKEYSIDGKIWKKIPNGIKVTGSKYALVCSSLVTVKRNIDLSQYNVAIGPSKNKLASEYIKFRIDKGCLINNNKLEKGDDSTMVEIRLCAKIIHPYAVLLR